MSENGFESTTDFNAFVGYRLVDWGMGSSEIELSLQPHHLNSQGFAHGGVIMSLLDSACGACGTVEPRPAPRAISVTVSLSANFIRTAKGSKLRAKGRMTGGGRSIYFAEAQILDDDGQLIATASGAFKRMDRLKERTKD